MHTRAGLGTIVALFAVAGLGGCATSAPKSVSDDQALCAQATAQARRGDQAWTATIDRMSSLQAVQRCQDSINQYVFGSLNGGGP